MSDTTVSAVLNALGERMDYSIADRSFSPFYSDIGLGFVDPPATEGEAAGINALYLHYNRATTRFGAPFLRLICDGPPATSRRTPLMVEQAFFGGRSQTAFYDRNSFIVECTGLDGMSFLFASQGKVPEQERVTERNGCLLFEGYLERADGRDPDSLFPIIIGMRVLSGKTSGDGLERALRVSPAGGKASVAFSVDVQEIDRAKIERLLLGAPAGVTDAAAATRDWLEATLGDLDVTPIEGLTDDPDAEGRVLAEAAYAMAANLTQAPGMMRDLIMLYPARGSYPIIAPWDACFHTVALDHMRPGLSEDEIYFLTDNGIRADGKQACFIASTWRRPELAQPALAGWAANRIYERIQDTAFLECILPGLLLNNRWWLSNRMTRYGVVSCPHGIESGWDNSPRWDKGPILALEMNTWLLMQMRLTEKFARILGQDDTAEAVKAEADELEAAMVRVLYDAERNIFRDVVLETGEPVDLVTPASVLPLLAGIDIGEEKARELIEGVLLDPKRLYGEYPFPCVAYDEEVYVSHNYWRGPVWMPVAYMMLELLTMFGYDVQRREATERLYRMVIKDRDLREWFDSQDGHGCGATQQGWTAAIMLQLRKELA